MTASPSESKPAAARNPVERIVVWGLIGILGILAILEGSTRFAYTNSLSRLRARLQDDDTADAVPLTLAEAEKMISGSPKKTVGERVVSYRFQGLLKEFGTIHLPHDADQVVLGLETADAPEPQEREVVRTVGEDGYALQEESSDSSSSSGPPAGSGGAGSGGPGGGRTFDPMQFDANGDGKLSIDEVPERMKENFAEIDLNGDGFLDAEELAARRNARGGPGGAGAGERPRPQRPSEDESVDKPADEKPAEGKPAAETTSPAEPASDE